MRPIALITGGSRGIDAATARLVAEAVIWLASDRADRCQFSAVGAATASPEFALPGWVSALRGGAKLRTTSPAFADGRPVVVLNPT